MAKNGATKARQSKISRKGGKFDTTGKKITGLAQWDDVRTYTQGKRLGWQIPVQEILQHVIACERECPQLGMTLDTLFVIVSAYQKQAA
jgi:hypothetical protein